MTSESMGIPLTGQNPQPAQTVGYDIDSVLNFRSITRTANDAGIATATTTPFTINSRNQYTSLGTESLGYDRNGNLTSRNGARLQYDYENRLRKAILPAGSTIENLYDATGRKVEEKITNGGTAYTTDYALSADQVKEEYTGGILARRYVNGREIDEIVRADLGATTIYPLQDELGNVERLTDATGTTLERYEYEGYGHFTVFNPANTPLATSALGWNRLFQGREYQPTLGAYDFRARTLWPDLGRFGQEDPARRREGTSAYQGLLGSPANLIDPAGLYEEDVHHYLTWYLARAAGFEQPVARSLGYETGHLDFDERNAMEGGRNFESWSSYHFVSAARLNGIRSNVMNRIKYERDDRQIGEYFHALQDSYSHQTNPHRRQFGAEFGMQFHFGHGLKGHDPDQTWKRPGLAMLMAEDTYRQAKVFCDQLGSCEGLTPFEGRIRKRVAAFNLYEPPTYRDTIYGFQVDEVCDYSLKIKLLDRLFEVASYERNPREKQYQDMLVRLHVTHAYAGIPCGGQ